MNWLVFALIAYVALVLEAGLGEVLSVGQVSPSFLLILGVYLGMTAPRSVVPWAMLVVGVLADLQPGPDLMPGRGYEDVILGPSALGYLVGAYAVLQLRGLTFRDSVVALSVMVFVVGIFVGLTEVGLLTLRGLPWLTGQPIQDWSAPAQLVQRFLELIYSAVVAVPAGWLLLRSTPMWSFHHKPRQG